VLVDWSQNDEHKTTVSVYSLRAREHPTVSTPVEWEEVERALKKKDPSLLVFEAGQALERVQKMGDLFEPVLKLKQKLPKLAGTTEAARSAVAEIAAQSEAPKHQSSKRKAKPQSHRTTAGKQHKQV
jgi:LigD, primase-polymerase domain